jgi:hypothetical protein
MLLGFSLIFSLLGCTSAEKADVVSALQTALSDLTQNRALTEQYVRDCKADISPNDPNYVPVMEAYQDARDIYNRYLDLVESGTKSDDQRSLRSSSSRDVENAAADFLAVATRSLRPGVDTRGIPFQRAVMLPEHLQETLAKLPKKARQKLTNNFDSQVRWRSWSQL